MLEKLEMLPVDLNQTEVPGAVDAAVEIEQHEATNLNIYLSGPPDSKNLWITGMKIGPKLWVERIQHKKFSGWRVFVHSHDVDNNSFASIIIGDDGKWVFKLPDDCKITVKDGLKVEGKFQPDLGE